MREELVPSLWEQGAASEALGVFACLDDIVVRVPPELTSRVVPVAAEALEAMGGTLKPSKRHAWSPLKPEPQG